MTDTILAMTVFVVLPTLGRAASNDDPTALAAKLSAQLGVEVTHRTEGTAVTTEWKRAGVTLSQTRDGSIVTTYGNDESGKGAVLCTWMMDVTIRSALQACPEDGSAELRDDLDQAIGRIDAFIIANSLEPVTIDALHARETTIAADALRSDGTVREQAQQGPKACSTGD